MRYTVKSDDKDEILKQTKGIFNKCRMLLVTGFLRYFKTTSVLDWAIRQGDKVVYVVRTNKTTGESVTKAEKSVLEAGKQLVTLSGKQRICKRIRTHLKDDDEKSFQLLKVKYCYKCPYKPGRSNPLTRDMKDDIDAQNIIDSECLDEYYENGVCPAEVILHAAESFDVIFMTYAWLHFIKDLGEGKLSHVFKGAVVIFDEARHLMDFGVEQEGLGFRRDGKLSLPGVKETREFIDWFKPIADHFKKRQFKRKTMQNLKQNSKMVISVLEDYCLMVEQLVSGWPRGIGPDDEDIQAAIRFVEYQLQQVRDDDKIKMLEQAAVRLLWMRRHSESELFVDENRSMLQKEGNYNIDLTARQPKDKLVGILEEAGKVVLIDSTPPPTRWSDLWLGKVFDIDVLTLNPATQPDIRVWVENAERRWSYMDRHQGVMDRQFAFLNKICLYNDEKWIISTRNKMETNAMSYLREFGNEVIWQGGVESEGVQLSGNHVLTGLQYTYNASYPSQKKYILEKIGKDPDSDEEWDKFLRLRTYQSIIQQLFRTYYHNRKARMILLGTPVEEIERMTKAYPYLKLVKFSLMPKGQHIKNKMGQLERFLEDDEFIEDKNDFIKKRILANFEFNSVTRTQIYNFLNRYDMPRTKVVLDEMNWKGSGSGRY